MTLWTVAYGFTKNRRGRSLLRSLRGRRKLISLTGKWCLCKRRTMIINIKHIWKNEPLLWQFFKHSCYFSPNTKLKESNFLLSLQKVTNYCVSKFEGQQYFIAVVWFSKMVYTWSYLHSDSLGLIHSSFWQGKIFVVNLENNLTWIIEYSKCLSLHCLFNSNKAKYVFT